ncbi:MAG: O-antigen ligase family protein [Patescibacteria group bacterium]
MTKDNALSFYLRATKFFIGLSLFSPLVLSALFYFPYIVPKTIFFQVAVELALLLWALLCVLDEKYRPKFDRIAVAVSAFFAIYVIAALLGANPLRSFLGTYERMLSVVNLAHFIALFFIARAVFGTPREWLILLRTFVAVSVVVSVYAVAQKLGWGSLVYHAGIDRLDSTIGNAAFVGGYLIFAIFFAVFLLVRDAHTAMRTLYAGCIVLNLAILYFTGTRGAVLGMACAVVVLVVGYLFRPRTVPGLSARMLGWGMGVLFLAGAVALVIGGGAENGALSYLKRFTSVSLADTTVQTRLLSVQTSMAGFKERPVLGWGPENYNLVFDKYYNPKLYPTENWFDHAHNIVFDIVTTTGVVGAAAYLFLMFVLLAACIRHARAGPESYWLGVFALGLLAAYGAQNLFVFDSLVTYLPFFLFAAFAANGFPLGRDAQLSDRPERAKQFANPSAKAALALVPLAMLLIYMVNVRPAVAAYYAVVGLTTNPAHADDAMNYFKRSLAWGNFGAHEIRGKLATYVSDLLDNTQMTDEAAKGRLATFVVAEMEKNITEQPLDFRNYLYYASFLNDYAEALASYGVADPLARADEVLAVAQKLGPHKPILHLQWAQVKVARGDVAGAAQLMEEAAVLRPDMAEFPLRAGGMFQQVGEREKAMAFFKDVKERFGTQLTAQQFVQLAVGLANGGDKEGAIQAAKKAVELDRNLSAGYEEFVRKVKEMP